MPIGPGKYGANAEAILKSIDDGDICVVVLNGRKGVAYDVAVTNPVLLKTVPGMLRLVGGFDGPPNGSRRDADHGSDRLRVEAETMNDHERQIRLAMPADQAKRLLEALDAGWRLESNPTKIQARYKDYDLAETVPRVIMYTDIGALVGRIHTLEAFLIEQGYQLADVD